MKFVNFKGSLYNLSLLNYAVIDKSGRLSIKFDQDEIDYVLNKEVSEDLYHDLYQFMINEEILYDFDNSKIALQGFFEIRSENSKSKEFNPFESNKNK